MQNNNSKTLSQNRNTRGGQIYFHEWRMRLQDMTMVMKISLIFLIVGFLTGLVLFKVTTWQLIDLYLLTYIPTHLKIFFWPWIQGVLVDLDVSLRGFFSGSKGIPSAYKTLGQLTTDLTLENSKTITFNSIQFINHPWIKLQLSSIYKSYFLAFASWLVGVGYMFYRFKRKSDQIDKDKYLRGKKIQSPKQVAKLINKKGIPTFHLSPDVPLPRATENQHIAIFGGTRMGKTNCMMGMLKQIRDKGDRAIIIDSTGEFTSKFYREGTDKLLNPFDLRSVSWDIWQENLQKHQYDAWADTVVPQVERGDTYWVDSARDVLAATAVKLENNLQKSMKEILHWACRAPLDEKVTTFYQGTAAATLMHKDQKSAPSVRSVLNNSIAAFDYLDHKNNGFSITDWVANQKHTDEWLFITATEGQISSLAPLMSSWFDMASLGLMKAGQDFTNRLWMIVDELPGLNIPIIGLQKLLTQGAKYGACCMLGFQNKSQIDHLYGNSVTRTILSNCSTKIIFRSPDFDTARDLSAAIGEHEILVTTESYSVGAHQVRDGVSLAAQNQKKFTVTPDEIMALNERESYVLLAGDYPIVKTKYKINALPDIAAPFTPKYN